METGPSLPAPLLGHGRFVWGLSYSQGSRLSQPQAGWAWSRAGAAASFVSKTPVPLSALGANEGARKYCCQTCAILLVQEQPWTPVLPLRLCLKHRLEQTRQYQSHSSPGSGALPTVMASTQLCPEDFTLFTAAWCPSQHKVQAGKCL